MDTDSSVISELISGGLALIGTFGGILAGNKLTTYRISELEKKVDKHNNLVKRIPRPSVSLVMLWGGFYFVCLVNSILIRSC